MESYFFATLILTALDYHASRFLRGVKAFRAKRAFTPGKKPGYSLSGAVVTFPRVNMHIKSDILKSY